MGLLRKKFELFVNENLTRAEILYLENHEEEYNKKYLEFIKTLKEYKE